MHSETMTGTGSKTRKVGWGTIVLLGVAGVSAAIFLVGFALPYLSLDQQRFGIYWAKRGWLLLHISGGMLALSLGPFVLWLGLNRRRMPLHRMLGIGYISCVGLSSIAAFYLASHTELGWVFGAGLSGLAIAWIVTTGMALVSIRKRLIAQHQEWMIRSYVVTFAFVNFRIFAGILQVAGVGTLFEQLAAASWFCWAVPLLITEVALQGRKIFQVTS
jgi:Predicted membrane protein (DUF2306)